MFAAPGYEVRGRCEIGWEGCVLVLNLFADPYSIVVGPIQKYVSLEIEYCTYKNSMW